MGEVSKYESCSVSCKYSGNERHLIGVAGLVLLYFLILAGSAEAQNYIVPAAASANKNLTSIFRQVTSFSVASTTTIDGIRFQLFRVGGGAGIGTIDVEIRDSMSQGLLAAGSISRKIAAAADVTYTINFARPFSASSGANYVVYLRSSVTVSPRVGVKFSDIAFLGQSNTAPVADAGPDQSVGWGAAVSLTGAGSSDADADDTLSYAWSQIGGTDVVLSGAATVSPTFIAPTLAILDRPEVLTFELVVTDNHGLGSLADSVQIAVGPGVAPELLSPVVDAFRAATGAFVGRRMERLLASEPLAHRFDHRRLAGGHARLNALSSDETGAPVTQLALSGRWFSTDRSLYFWSEGSGSFYVDETGDLAERSGNFSALYFGGDYLISPSIAVGLMAEIDSTRESIDDYSRIHGLGWMIGPYLSADIGSDLTFSLRASWGQSDNAARIDVFEDDRIFRGDFSTRRSLISASLQGALHSGGMAISPSAELFYLRENLRGYTVSNGTADVPVDGISSELGRLSMAADIEWVSRFPIAMPIFFAKPRIDWNLINGGLAGALETYLASVEIGLRTDESGPWMGEASIRYGGLGATDISAVTFRAILSAQF